MTNRELIKKALQENGYELGCCTKQVEDLTKRTLIRLIDALLLNEATHVIFTNKGTKYVAMLDTVDNEKDITIVTCKTYEQQFGSKA